MIRNRLRVDRGEREWENFKQSEKYISKISKLSRNGMHQVNSSMNDLDSSKRLIK